MSENKHWWLYVLKLEQGKWYVGITSQTPEKRFKEHLGGRKTRWTNKYPPVKVIDTKYLGELPYEDVKVYENKVTRMYMKKKGVNNVRGGDLTDTSSYKIRFGYVWDEIRWGALVTILIQTLIILLLGIDLYIR